MTQFHVIIPARFHSTRLPEKALKKIGDKAMINHVCDQAMRSGASSVTVATDHERIYEVVKSAGSDAVMTKESHPSGSDRVFEAADIIGLSDDDIVVNVQGDEPFIPSENINRVASLLEETRMPMSTLCCAIEHGEEVLNANAVKVVFDNQNRALYFSRSPIPYCRENPVNESQASLTDYFRHIGIYAYRKGFLQQFIQWPPSRLETMESLEQLRVLDNGYGIAIDSLEQAPPTGVDTPEDLQAAREHWHSVHG